MAQNKSSQGKLPDWAGSSSYFAASGVKLDPGPYLGIIKNNADPARAGRLAVWVPAIGGDEDDADKWYVVRYASPFLGSTIGSTSDDSKNFSASQQTYGFWAVPPDIGNLVLITFIMGDPNQGFWFACVPNTPTTHMIPGLARPSGNVVGTDKINQDPSFGSGRITSESFLPTSELKSENSSVEQNPEFYNLPKVVHTYQANIVIEQGLDKDPVRGTISSSSQRETPSQVVGISTPGRTIPDVADFPNLDTILQEGSLPVSLLQNFPNRKGGHSFVMDDGDVYGQNRLLRLRSSSGHISNSHGTAWIELTPDGSINIFSNSNVSVRAQKDINFHADRDINIHSGNTIRIHAEKYFLNQTESYQVTALNNYSLNAGNIGIKSGTSLLFESVTAGMKTSADIILKGRKIFLNTSTPNSPLTNQSLEFYKQANVLYDNNEKLWKLSSDTFDSLAVFAPTHEPWMRKSGELKMNSGQTILPAAQTPGKT